MAILTADARKKLKDSDFALPGRKYPIHNAAHARDALARAAHDATPAEQATIKSKVAKRYPSMKLKKNPHKPGTISHMMAED